MHVPRSPPQRRRGDVGVLRGAIPEPIITIRHGAGVPFYLVFGAQVKIPKSRRQSHNNMIRVYPLYYVFAALQTTKQ